MPGAMPGACSVAARNAGCRCRCRVPCGQFRLCTAGGCRRVRCEAAVWRPPSLFPTPPPHTRARACGVMPPKGWRHGVPVGFCGRSCGGAGRAMPQLRALTLPFLRWRAGFALAGVLRPSRALRRRWPSKTYSARLCTRRCTAPAPPRLRPPHTCAPSCSDMTPPSTAFVIVPTCAAVHRDLQELTDEELKALQDIAGYAQWLPPCLAHPPAPGPCAELLRCGLLSPVHPVDTGARSVIRNLCARASCAGVALPVCAAPCPAGPAQLQERGQDRVRHLRRLQRIQGLGQPHHKRNCARVPRGAALASGPGAGRGWAPVEGSRRFFPSHYPPHQM